VERVRSDRETCRETDDVFVCACFFASSHAPMAGGQNGNWKDTLVVPPKDERYRTEVSNCREFSRNLAEI
jgi:hypothetical protein